MPDGPDSAETEMLRRFLAERDVACPGCGYNLRGLTAHRCPECNQFLTLQVALSEPRLASFIAGIVALSIGPGVCAVGLALGVYEMIRHPSSSAVPHDLLPLVCGVGFGCVAIPYWSRKRGLFLAADAASRWILVGVAAVAGLLFLVWFFFWVS